MCLGFEPSLRAGGVSGGGGSKWASIVLPHKKRGIFNNYNNYILKGQRHEIFDFKFFHESVSPKLWGYHSGRFEFFRKFAEIFAAQGAPPVSLTPVANEKISIRKVLIIFLGHQWLDELPYRSLFSKIPCNGAQAWDIRSLGFSWFLHHKVSTCGRLRG